MAYKIELDKDKLQQELTPLEYNVCLNHGTEAPFQNEFHDAKTEGLYSCKCCQTPLFDSNTKFDSGTAKNFSGFSRSSEEVKGILEISSKDFTSFGFKSYFLKSS